MLTPRRSPSSRFGDLTGEPSWLASAAQPFQHATPVRTPAHLKHAGSDIMKQLQYSTPKRSPTSRFADLTGEPSWLASAGRRFHGQAPLPTPKRLNMDEGIMKSLRKGDCRVAPCAAFTKQGAPCKNCTTGRSKFCQVHKRKTSKKSQ